MQDSTLNLLLVLGVGVIGGYAISELYSKKKDKFLERESEMSADDYADMYGDSDDSFESSGDEDWASLGASDEPPPALRDWDKRKRKASAAAKRAAKATGRVGKRAGRGLQESYSYAAPKIGRVARQGYEGAIKYGKQGAKALDDMTLMDSSSSRSSSPLPRQQAKTIFAMPSPSAFDRRPVAKTVLDETEQERVLRIFGPELVASEARREMSEAQTRVSRPNRGKRRGKGRK